MSHPKPITSQDQYLKYKEERVRVQKLTNPSTVINQLTELIIEWEIKQDPSIKRDKGKDK